MAITRSATKFALAAHIANTANPHASANYPVVHIQIDIPPIGGFDDEGVPVNNGDLWVTEGT